MRGETKWKEEEGGGVLYWQREQGNRHVLLWGKSEALQQGGEGLGILLRHESAQALGLLLQRAELS